MRHLIQADISKASPSALTSLAKAMAIATLMIGAAGLSGLWLGVPELLEFLPGRPRITANSAIMLMLLATASWLVLPEPTTPRARLRFHLGQALAMLPAALGLASLAEYLLGWNPGIDLLLFEDASAAQQAFPGRPSFPCALGGVGLGLGVVLLSVRFCGLWLTEVCAVATTQIAVLALIGHLFGVWELYGGFSSMRGNGMALPTAAGFLFLGTGLLFARADRGIMAVVRSHTPGGMMARRWMLMPPLVLLIMGLVYVTLNRSGRVDQAIGSWLMFMTSLLVLTLAVWTTAEVLHRAGLERDQAHRTLEERVRTRTAELNLANEALKAAKEELALANQRLEKTVHERTRHLNETIASLETVCYNIAHDLRAPNRAVAGFAQVLLSQYASRLDPTARQYLERMAAAALRSDALTLDLLAYGRLGHAHLPCAKQCLETHLHAVLDKLAIEVAATGASVEISEPLPDLWANSSALEQILTNLLTNALKFVPKGVRPRVVVRAEDLGATCRVLVEDNGIGIPPEYQQNIFGVFNRLHSTEQYPGSGIGLAIVKKSLERMGGKVGVNSSVGKGSSFWFELRKA